MMSRYTFLGACMLVACLFPVSEARASHADSETGPLNTVSPIITDIVASPSVASHGETTTVSFIVSKMFVNIPEVTINGRQATFASYDVSPKYTFMYVVHRADSVGPAMITVSGRDALGNRGTASNSDALTIIKTTPLYTLPFFLVLLIIGVALTAEKKRRIVVTFLLFLIAAFLFTPMFAYGAAPQVSNVRFIQSPDIEDGTQVDIYYDLVAPNAPCTITVSLSKNDGEDGFPYPVTSVSGALVSVTTGQDHHIRWDISQDYPEEDIPAAKIRIAADEVFTFVFLTDTHLGMKCSENNLRGISQWIVNQADFLNIRYAAHLGDVCDERTETSLGDLMKKARNALQPIRDAGIPFSVAIGNHDYRYLPEEALRSAEDFNHSEAFGREFYDGLPWYRGCFEDEAPSPGAYPGGTVNHYSTQDIAGLSFLFLTLEHYPRDKVLDWADNLVQNIYPDHHVIVCTHAFLTQNGALSTGSYASGGTGPDFSNSGANMWDRYFKNWKNLRFVLNGHFINEPRQAYLLLTGEHGNGVHCHFFNYQNWGYRFNALYYVTRNGVHQAATIKLFTIYPYTNRVAIRNFTPSANTVVEEAIPDAHEFIVSQ